MEEIGH
jgi:hypothetical protein